MPRTSRGESEAVRLRHSIFQVFAIGSAATMDDVIGLYECVKQRLFKYFFWYARPDPGYSSWQRGRRGLGRIRKVPRSIVEAQSSG
jgi:hypothetical protein